MKRIIPILGALCLVFLAAAPAMACFSLSVGYGIGDAGVTTIGTEDADLGAFQLGLAWQKADFYLGLDYVLGTLDPDIAGETGFNYGDVWAAYRFLDTERIDLLAGLVVYRLQTGGVVSGGPALGLGLRYDLSEKWSLQGGLAYGPWGQSLTYDGAACTDPSFWSGMLQVNYAISEPWSVYASYRHYDFDGTYGSDRLHGADDLFSLGLVFRPQAPSKETPARTAKRVEAVNQFLQPVFFDLDSAAIRADQEKTLANNLKILQENKDLYILIGGHADSKGTNDYNLALSQRRAEAVRDWLVSHGVDAGRITIVAYGEDYPYLAKETDPSWESDRWVDTVVTDKKPTKEAGIRS